MNRVNKIGIGLCSVSVIIVLVQTFWGEDIKVSQSALEIIGNAEGCKREPYKCPANILTVGIGSTQASGELINPHKTYTDLEIAERWKNDIVKAQQCVEYYAKGQIGMPKSVYDATVSITFNVGCSAMKKSALFRYISIAKYEQACNEFPKWIYAGGQRLRGLEIRREKEKVLCLMDLQRR